jgi:lipopolysaccharide assembly protein A
MRVIFWAVMLVAVLLLIPFAVSNRAIVSLGLWPLPFVVDLPLYLLALSLSLAGFVVGAATAWIGGRRARRELRGRRRRVKALELELKAARSQQGDQTTKGRQEVLA